MKSAQRLTAVLLLGCVSLMSGVSTVGAGSRSISVDNAAYDGQVDAYVKGPVKRNTGVYVECHVANDPPDSAGVFRQHAPVVVNRARLGPFVEGANPWPVTENATCVVSLGEFTELGGFVVYTGNRAVTASFTVFR